MKLQNEQQIENTRQKLADLQALLKKREHDPPVNDAHDWAIEGLKRWERRLQAEIEEYEAAHQRA